MWEYFSATGVDTVNVLSNDCIVQEESDDVAHPHGAHTVHLTALLSGNIPHAMTASQVTAESGITSCVEDAVIYAQITNSASLLDRLVIVHSAGPVIALQSLLDG